MFCGPIRSGPTDFSRWYELQASCWRRGQAHFSVATATALGCITRPYNLNDEAIRYGESRWIKLVETTLAV
jgi:hypothetical protein